MPASDTPRSNVLGYDDSDWPIVRVNPPPPGSDEEEFKRHLDRLTIAFSRGQAFAVLVDPRGFPLPSPRERQLVAERLAKNQAAGPFLKAMAVLVESRVQRGIFTAIHWLVRPGYPTAAFESEVEAKRWLRRCLDAAVALTR